MCTQLKLYGTTTNRCRAQPDSNPIRSHFRLQTRPNTNGEIGGRGAGRESKLAWNKANRHCPTILVATATVLNAKETPIGGGSMIHLVDLDDDTDVSSDDTDIDKRISLKGRERENHRVECTRTILPCCCWFWCSRALRRSLSALVGLGIGTAPGNVPMLRELSERFRLLPPDAAKCDMLRLMLEALRGWLCCSVNVLSSVGRFLGCASWSSLDME